MNKNLTFKLLGIMLFPIICYSQVNPRMVNAKYSQTFFYDDFSSSQDFSTNWEAANWTKDNSLYSAIDSSATIILDTNNEELKLRMIKVPGGYIHSYWEGTFTTNFITGEIKSKKKDFAYGVYECEATFAHDKGSFPAFWLYNESDCNISKRNEIDIVECKVDHSEPTLDNNMFYYPPNCGSKSGFGFEAHPFNTWDQSHIFKCVYAPDRIEFWVDDELYHTFENDGSYKYPDQGMTILLSQQVIRYDDYQSNIVAPQTSSFNWVRAKEFFLAPEITLSSDLICTSGTASMDVHENATSIS